MIDTKLDLNKFLFEKVILVIAALCIVVSCAGWYLSNTDVGQFKPGQGHNVFICLFVWTEKWTPLFILIFLNIVVKAREAPLPGYRSRLVSGFDKIPLLIIVCCLFFLQVILLYPLDSLFRFRFPLSLDEYCNYLQSFLFSKGRLFGQLPQSLISERASVLNHFLISNDSGRWYSPYLPVYSGMLSFFTVVDVGLGPLVFHLLTLLGLWRLLTTVCKFDTKAARITLLLVSTSPQLFVTPLTLYSSVGHLCVNTWWLVCLKSHSKLHIVACAVIGSLALGLHQPHVHLLFASPFLMCLLIDKYYTKFALLIVAYAVAAVLGLNYWGDIGKDVSSIGVNFFDLPSGRTLGIQLIYCWYLCSWLALPCIPLFFWAVRHVFRKPKLDFITQCIFCSLVHAGFYIFFVPDQGHGWGYRYMYPALVSVFVVCGYAIDKLFYSEYKYQLLYFISAGSLITLFLLLPIRIFQASSLIRTQSQMYYLLADLGLKYVVLDTNAVWYGGDLIRNEFFEDGRSVVMRLDRLKLKRYQRLKPIELDPTNPLNGKVWTLTGHL
jgi:hypothetical protein